MSNLGWIILYGTAVYHASVGLVVVCSADFSRRVGWKLYRLKIEGKLDPKFEYVLKPLGVYALTLTLLCVYVIRRNDPALLDFMRYMLSFLFAGRAICRWHYAPLFREAFKVSSRQNYINICFNFILVGLLLLFGRA